MMSEYTQGIAFDGVAILKDGQPLRPDDIVTELRRLAQLEAAIRWALGESPEGMPAFPARPEGAGMYYWRTQLRELSGIAYTPPQTGEG